MKQVVLISGEPERAAICEAVLKALVCDITRLESWAEVSGCAVLTSARLILIDVGSAADHWHALEQVQRLRNEQPEAPLALVGADVSAETVVAALRFGCVDVFLAPLQEEALTAQMMALFGRLHRRGKTALEPAQSAAATPPAPHGQAAKHRKAARGTQESFTGDAVDWAQLKEEAASARHLAAEVSRLQAERGSLQTRLKEQEAVIQESHKEDGQFHRLEAYREQLAEEREAITAERATLATDRDALDEEKQHFEDQLEALKEERRELKQELQQMQLSLTEREQLLEAEIALFVTEKEHLLKRAQTPPDELQRSLREREAQLDVFQAELERREKLLREQPGKSGNDPDADPRPRRSETPRLSWTTRT